MWFIINLFIHPLLLANNRDFNPAATLLLLILMSEFHLKLVMLADGTTRPRPGMEDSTG
jgi:hypothetical protein